MDYIMNYVKPELMIVAVALYFVGIAIKKSEKLLDRGIPFILGMLGIVLAALYVFATSKISSFQDVLMALFTSIVQGILVAGLSTYVNQCIKQIGKDE